MQSLGLETKSVKAEGSFTCDFGANWCQAVHSPGGKDRARCRSRWHSVPSQPGLHPHTLEGGTGQLGMVYFCLASKSNSDVLLGGWKIPWHVCRRRDINLLVSWLDPKLNGSVLSNFSCILTDAAVTAALLLPDWSRLWNRPLMYIPLLLPHKCQVKQHLTVLVKFVLHISTVVETGTVEISYFITIFCRFFHQTKKLWNWNAFTLLCCWRYNCETRYIFSTVL